MTVHDPDCGCDTYGCQLRRKGVDFSGAATPTRRARRPFRKAEQPSWEKGKSGEHRADGSFMPYLNERGTPIGVKEYGENRHRLSEIRRHQVAGPAPQE